MYFLIPTYFFISSYFFFSTAAHNCYICYFQKCPKILSCSFYLLFFSILHSTPQDILNVHSPLKCLFYLIPFTSSVLLSILSPPPHNFF
jgi:hypothetical protein